MLKRLLIVASSIILYTRMSHIFAPPFFTACCCFLIAGHSWRSSASLPYESRLGYLSDHFVFVCYFYGRIISTKFTLLFIQLILFVVFLCMPHFLFYLGWFYYQVSSEISFLLPPFSPLFFRCGPVSLSIHKITGWIFLPLVFLCWLENGF